MKRLFRWLIKLSRRFRPEISGRDRSRDFNRLHGTFYVIYPDGQKSEPMCNDVACGYAKVFGGKVEPLE